MNFKRKEGFRYVFDEPVDANFSLFVNGRQINSETYTCKILDISPRGMKLYSEAPITQFYDSELQFEIIFILDVTPIKTIGQVVWSKPYRVGKYYGLMLDGQSDVDKLIISELKHRRKKEVFQSKNKDC